ncbi:uncharacterized protein [Littorina saxatilis]|uniref:THAP-type domain-containing protein n=1 Tax=Littorina saxatilis TaxID=31220 RepID=A0AAN9B3S1_9CAEN
MPPNKRCAWGQCKTDDRYPERCVGVKFIPFVKPGKHLYHLDRCLRWIKACNRPAYQLNVNTIKSYTYICSKHFKDGWPSEENPDPLSAIASENDQPKKRKLPLKRSEPPPPKTRKLTAARILDSLGVAPEQGLLPNEELSEVAPQQGLLPIEEPSEVKRKCDEEAEATVSKICQTVFSSRKTAKNERVLQLVKGLTSLMLQIRTFSESDFNSFEFRSLQDSLKEIKETLDTNNINSFQNNVEIHISHIESWLSQMGNVHASAASMQDT